MYVVPSKLQPPVHLTMWPPASTLNSTVTGTPLTRECSPVESLYELVTKAPWTGENETGDAVVAGNALDGTGAVASGMARTVAGDVAGEEPDDEPTHTPRRGRSRRQTFA